ncbi:MAG: oligosaccharide flippase family protein [Bacteroidetes bacterium]|nr:oligosaccharide flippase family protein [Bacteroidota bacterium]
MIRKFLPKSGFARNVLTLFTGSTIAQLIPVAISPLLTRIFPVTDFATLTVFSTLVSFLGVIVCGRYEIAIGLPSEDKDAKQILYLALMVTLIVSSIAMVLALIFNNFIAELLNNQAAAPYILLVPLAALFYGLNQALTYWNIRKRQYALMSGSRIGQSLTNSGTSLASGYSGAAYNGLVIGQLSGFAAAFFYTYFRTLFSGGDTFSRKEANKSEMKRLALKYIDQPRVNGVHAFTDMLQVTGVVFIISAVFGSITTGLYGLAIRILQAPLNMIGSSFSIVFYKEASEKVATGQKITKLLKTTILTLALISFPVFLIIMIFGPSLFAFVFGEVWREAGVYARILSPWLFVGFISSPVSHLPVILNQQRQFFLLSLIGNSLMIISILCGAFIFDDIKMGLLLISVSQVIFLSCLLVYFYKISKKAHG